MIRAVALGNFDGVHLAHRKRLKCTAQKAKEMNISSAAYIFETHPQIFFGKSDFSFIMQNTVKEKEIKALGISEVIFEKTTSEILGMTPEEFVYEILIKKLSAKAVFAGYNYTFGKGGKGDSTLLRKLCRERGIEVFILENETLDGEEISSSHIRECLLEGDIKRANMLLGGEFTLLGNVTSGKHLGEKIGFRTANVPFPENMLIPYNGVYKTETEVSGRVYKSVTNVGSNPTVEDIAPRAESHIIDFDGDIYGEEIKIRFLEKIRDEIKFESIDALKNQIEKDKNCVLGS